MEFALGLLGLLYLASPLFVWILVHRHWKKLGKDPLPANTTIIPQYEPFRNLPPALIGVVYDTRANDYDLTATLLDWAARRIIRLDNFSQVEKRWHGKLKIYHEVNYQLTLLHPTALQDTSLQPYERLILTTCFQTASTVSLAIAIRRLARAQLAIRTQLYQDAVTAGLFTTSAALWRERYYKASSWLIVIGFITAFVGVGLPIMAYGFTFKMYSPWMAQRTALGAEAKQWCEGFKMYLYHAERFRAQRMTIELAEQLLPYIIVLHLQTPAWQLEFPKAISTLAETKI